MEMTKRIAIWRGEDFLARDGKMCYLFLFNYPWLGLETLL